MLYTVPGVPRFGTRKTGEPLGSSPGNILANQIRTLVPPVSQVALPRERIPSLSVILSPGSMIGHTPRKNPTRLSPDGNLPHPRISMACTTCIIAQALCSREVFYHICVDYARVFREKDKFSFLFFPFCQNAGFVCRMHNSAAARAQEARGAAAPGREEAPRRRVRAGRVCPKIREMIRTTLQIKSSRYLLRAGNPMFLSSVLEGRPFP